MSSRRSVLLALVCLSSFQGFVRADDTLAELVDQLIKPFPGQVWLFAKNLTTGAEFGIRADERVRTASTIKLPIMIGAFAEVERGRVQWTDELLLAKGKKVSGAGILFEFADGLKLTLRDAVHLMIVISDNTATNLVLDVVPGDIVNAEMERLGLQHTRSLRKIGGGGESKAFADPSNQRADGSTYGIGVATPREMVTLLDRLDQGKLVSPAASKEMLAILRRQQFHDGVGRSLKGVKVANKTGALDALRSDVALLDSPKGKLALAITCDGMPSVDWSPENPGLLLIDQLSRLLVERMLNTP